MKRSVRIRHKLMQQRPDKKHPKQVASSTIGSIQSPATLRQNIKRTRHSNQVSSNLSTKRFSTTRSWARTRNFITVLLRCVPKSSMRRKASKKWRKRFRNLRTTRESSARKALTTTDSPLKQIIKFWPWNASTRKVKRRSRRISSACRNSSKRKMRTSISQIRVWIKTVNRSRITEKKTSQTHKNSFKFASITSRTKIMKRSGY